MIKEEITIENAYQILGIDENCTDEEFEKTWKEKVKETHPDLNSKEGSEIIVKDDSQIKAVLEAKDVILRARKTEERIANRLAKKIKENSVEIELKKNDLLEIKRQKIVKVNNIVLQKGGVYGTSSAVMLLLINSFRDVEGPFSFIIQEMGKISSMALWGLHLIIIMGVILTMFMAIRNITYQRNEKLRIIEKEYSEELGKI